MAWLPRHALAGSSLATAVTQISPWRLTIEPVRFQAINRTRKLTYPMLVIFGAGPLTRRAAAADRRAARALDGGLHVEGAQPLTVPGDHQLALAEVAAVRPRDGDRRRVHPPDAFPVLDVVRFCAPPDKGFNERLRRDSLHADLGEKRVVIGRLLSLSRAHDFATTHTVSLCAWYEQVIETHLRRARRQCQTWICRM